MVGFVNPLSPLAITSFYKFILQMLLEMLLVTGMQILHIVSFV